MRGNEIAFDVRIICNSVKSNTINYHEIRVSSKFRRKRSRAMIDLMRNFCVIINCPYIQSFIRSFIHLLYTIRISQTEMSESLYESQTKKCELKEEQNGSILLNEN